MYGAARLPQFCTDHYRADEVRLAGASRSSSFLSMLPSFLTSIKNIITNTRNAAVAGRDATSPPSTIWPVKFRPISCGKARDGHNASQITAINDSKIALKRISALYMFFNLMTSIKLEALRFEFKPRI